MIKIDCKKYASEIKEKVKNSEKAGKLVILYAGDDKANESYMKGKIKDAEECGIEAIKIKCNTIEELVLAAIESERDNTVGGIMLQLPLPKGFDEKRVLCQIGADKDVDGFSEHSNFQPCTPEGIMYVLNKEIGNLSGMHAVLVGKGKLVGKPLINMLLDKGVTLSIISSKTTEKDKNKLLENCDIIITCVGKNGTVDLSKVNAQVVIDAGFGYVDGHICGDCIGYNWNNEEKEIEDFTFEGKYDHKNMKVTTVPNGIGLMTRAILMKHMIKE